MYQEMDNLQDCSAGFLWVALSIGSLLASILTVILSHGAFHLEELLGLIALWTVARRNMPARARIGLLSM